MTQKERDYSWLKSTGGNQHLRDTLRVPRLSITSRSGSEKSAGRGDSENHCKAYC